jgi:3-(3-hydroxy-phenyl)propionate hydroxylase
MARVIKGELPDSWLDTYETERRPNAVFYTNLAVALGRVIKQEASAEEIEALHAVPTETVTPYEPPLIAPPALEAGWIRGATGDASIVGRMIPQPIAGDTFGKMARLDALLGDGFVLLGVDTNPADLLTPEEKPAGTHSMLDTSRFAPKPLTRTVLMSWWISTTCCCLGYSATESKPSQYAQTSS